MKTNFFSFIFLKKIFRDFSKNFLKFFLIITIFLAGNGNIFVHADAQTQTPSNASIDKNGNPSFSSTGFTIDLTTLDPISRWAKGKPDGNNKNTSGGNAKDLFNKLMELFSNLLLFIIPILAGVSLIIAGYFYIFSFSDGELQSKAKTIIKYNLMAMLVAFLSYVIISIIAGFFI